MKRQILSILFLASVMSSYAQVSISAISPKYGCPNTTHNVDISVDNTSGYSVPIGTSYTVQLSIYSAQAALLKSVVLSFTDGIANGATKTATIPNVPFIGAMVCSVDVVIACSLIPPFPGTYHTSGTYTVQKPQNLTIQENPAGTLEVLTALDGYSVRYYKGTSTTVKDESLTGMYTPTASGSYNAKAYDPISGCKSASASNSVSISVVTGLLESKNISVSVYPNPMMSSVTISTGLSNTLTYELMDVKGNLLTTSEFTSVTNVNVENLNAGTYVLIIKENNEPVASYKLVK